jgi:hypothetical protein
MHTIAEFTSAHNLPQLIAQCVDIGVHGTPDRIKNELPARIQAVLFAAQRCREVASAAEDGFKRMGGLAQELVLACTHKVCASLWYPTRC